jgi:hypothetical protein
MEQTNQPGAADLTWPPRRRTKMKTKTIPAKLLRAIKILATANPVALSVETHFTIAACEEAIKTSQEYAQSGRMEG